MARKPILFVLRLIVFGLLLAVCAVSVSAQTDNPLPAPTGPYSVGVQWRHWVDDSRVETYPDAPDGNREMMVEILYPAEAGAATDGSPYIPNSDQVLPTFSELLTAFGVPLTVGPADVAEFQAHAIPDAPLADSETPYPVLIFSHGGAADITMYTAQLEELASQGYVVVGINHAYGAAATVFPDGRTVFGGLSLGLEDIATNWSQDQSFAMDQMEMLNEADPQDMFTDRLNVDGFGVFGASLGGAASTITCFTDQRCLAGANEDGPIYGEVIEQGLTQPFMYMFSDSRFFSDPEFLAESSGPIYIADFEGFEHLDFGDFTLWPNASEQLREVSWLGSVDAQRAVQLTRAYLVAFFDHHLKGSEMTLLNGSSQDNPEVTVEMLNE